MHYLPCSQRIDVVRFELYGIFRASSKETGSLGHLTPQTKPVCAWRLHTVYSNPLVTEFCFPKSKVRTTGIQSHKRLPMKLIFHEFSQVFLLMTIVPSSLRHKGYKSCIILPHPFEKFVRTCSAGLNSTRSGWLCSCLPECWQPAVLVTVVYGLVKESMDIHMYIHILDAILCQAHRTPHPQALLTKSISLPNEARLHMCSYLLAAYYNHKTSHSNTPGQAYNVHMNYAKHL